MAHSWPVQLTLLMNNPVCSYYGMAGSLQTGFLFTGLNYDAI
jgi:hypothetical protein